MENQPWQHEVDVTALTWITASSIGNCVEAASWQEWILVRDSKDPEGPVLRYTRTEFGIFPDGAASGVFDSLR